MKEWHAIVSNKDVTPLDHGDDGGAFRYRGFMVLVSWGLGWDHVSMSHTHRDPTWLEMEAVKRLCFLPDECAMQLHPPLEAYVNTHQHCLHLWRPQHDAIPMPPKVFV